MLRRVHCLSRISLLRTLPSRAWTVPVSIFVEVSCLKRVIRWSCRSLYLHTRPTCQRPGVRKPALHPITLNPQECALPCLTTAQHPHGRPLQSLSYPPHLRFDRTASHGIPHLLAGQVRGASQPPLRDTQSTTVMPRRTISTAMLRWHPCSTVPYPRNGVARSMASTVRTRLSCKRSTTHRVQRSLRL